MPIYEYKCENGHVFDVLQKMSDESLTECVECGAPAQRVLTAPAVHFKGSGFYNTDYGKRGSKPNGGSSEGSSSGSSDSKGSDSGSKSDSGSSGDSSKSAATSSSSNSD